MALKSVWQAFILKRAFGAFHAIIRWTPFHVGSPEPGVDQDGQAEGRTD
jgi:hypothetical protein